MGVLWHLPSPCISHAGQSCRYLTADDWPASKRRCHDIECLGVTWRYRSRDHWTHNIRFPNCNCNQLSISHCFWDITNYRQKNVVLPTHAHIWESYPSNFRTTLGPLSMGKITLLIREITFQLLSQYIYPNPPTLQTDDILIPITCCARTTC